MTAPTQLGLFAAPRTHTGDPATSHRAEARSKPRAKAHAAIVLEWVRLFALSDGVTATHLTGWLAADRRFSADYHTRLCQVRKRISDLRGAGLVERRTLKGSTEAVWYATRKENHERE